MADPIVQAAGRIVMIACKHPAGITLNLDKMVLIDKERGSARRVAGRSVVLRGWAYPAGSNQPDPAAATGGYVLTPVPADFWDEWIATHADFPMLEDKTILGPHRDAASQARDHAAVDKMFAPSSGELKELAQAQLTKD